jgi:hypothetical protein
MTTPLSRRLTVTIEITAIPEQSWTLENDSWERTLGYRIRFPDRHTVWVDERDFEELYLRNSPTGLLSK